MAETIQGRVTGITEPIALHKATPWYRYLSPRYTGRISVATEGRSPFAIARTWSHELKHVDDLERYPQSARLALRERYWFPGGGAARYCFEFRGYRAGGTLRSLATPLKSMPPTCRRYLVYDGLTLLYLGAGGATAVYLNVD